MIEELKRNLISDMEKLMDKLNNGYAVDFCCVIDQIYYIMSKSGEVVSTGMSFSDTVNISSPSSSSSTGEYVLPIASASILGGVKIGNNIHIGLDGTISIDDPFSFFKVKTTNLQDVPVELVINSEDTLEFENTTSIGWTIIDNKVRAVFMAPENISFEFRDITPGVAQTYDLDISADWCYIINFIKLETDTGTLDGVSLKVDGVSVVPLNSITVNTLVGKTIATSLNTVVENQRVSIITSTSYTGNPTLLKGKINFTRCLAELMPTTTTTTSTTSAVTTTTTVPVTTTTTLSPVTTTTPITTTTTTKPVTTTTTTVPITTISPGTTTTTTTAVPVTTTTTVPVTTTTTTEVVGPTTTTTTSGLETTTTTTTSEVTTTTTTPAVTTTTTIPVTTTTTTATEFLMNRDPFHLWVSAVAGTYNVAITSNLTDYVATPQAAWITSATFSPTNSNNTTLIIGIDTNAGGENIGDINLYYNTSTPDGAFNVRQSATGETGSSYTGSSIERASSGTTCSDTLDATYYSPATSLQSGMALYSDSSMTSPINGHDQWRALVDTNTSTKYSVQINTTGVVLNTKVVC